MDCEADGRASRGWLRQLLWLGVWLSLASPVAAQIALVNARNTDPSVILFRGRPTGSVVLGASNGLGSPRRVAVDPGSGELFFSDAFNQRVYRWSSSQGLRTFADSSDGIGNPTGLAFDSQGRLFVSNSRNSDASVLVFEPDGTGQTILGLGDGLGSPRGVAVDPLSGDLFIADALVQRVFRWDGSGLSTFADAADGVGNPAGLAFDGQGRLFVSNSRNSDASVLVFEASGSGQQILGLGDGLGSPRGLAFDPASGDLYIADALAQRVFRWNAGDGLSTFADAMDGIGNPEGVAAISATATGVPSLARSGQTLLVLLLAGLGWGVLRRS